MNDVKRSIPSPARATGMRRFALGFWSLGLAACAVATPGGAPEIETGRDTGGRELDPVADAGRIIDSGSRPDDATDTTADVAPEVLSACGDGTVDPSEECDDGNPEDGDGCSALCRLEGARTCEACDTPNDCAFAGSSCVELSDGRVCLPTCEDGVCPEGWSCVGNTVCVPPGRACADAPLPEDCGSGDDDDGDGLVDCADPDCDGNPLCPEPVELCANGVDDDGNGPVDCADSACLTDPACDEPAVEVCGGGL
ncbi:MAG: DUF4215 domain-containing protein, partial [Myxococcales bacterium]|nr:DUF4215 domain-containing protein [Myxococcales bacterium]